MQRQKFIAELTDVCVVMVPRGSALVMADSSFKIGLIYK